MIRTFKTGLHAHRTPLSYPALRPLFQYDILQVSDPDDADILIFGHILDIQDAPVDVIESWRRKQQPVVLLSEEPFWDTVWGRQPGLRDIEIDTTHGLLPVTQLNHHTSQIFNFECIPYYLLTNHRFAVSYAARFMQNRALSAAQWRARFQQYSHDLVFMFERRPETHHNVVWRDYDIIGLCAWRTEVAEISGTTKRVARLGHSWDKDIAKRQETVDWHLDKLVSRNGQQRILAAFENTHQPFYVSEKFFDAFACGALPAYFASDNHGIHRFSLPDTSWINCYGLSPKDAANTLLNACSITTQAAEDYVVAQNRLAALFTSTDIWLAERKRLHRALLHELERVLS